MFLGILVVIFLSFLTLCTSMRVPDMSVKFLSLCVRFCASIR